MADTAGTWQVWGLPPRTSPLQVKGISPHLFSNGGRSGLLHSRAT